MAGVSEYHGTDVDISTAIADFVADPNRHSFELPHMTTGQRKVAKRTVDEYSGLKCESFGFGQERQLHIFKVAMREVVVKAKRPSVASDCSTAASSPRPGSPTSSMASPEMPSLAAFRPPPGLEIRNTFLHVGGTSTVERAVQSMPHGMFGHCLAE